MTENKSVECADCSQPMDPVELHNIPGEVIKDFIDIPGNELEDNWYRCPMCETYKQEPIPIKLSPDIERLSKLLESFPGNW